MIPNPYVILGGALGALLLLIGAYLAGRSDGKAIQVGRQAAIEAAVAKERAAHEKVVDDGNAAGQTQETARATNTKEVYHEVEKITERPVYRNVCVDADGVRALERAATIANGEDPGKPAVGAAAGASAVQGGGRGPGRASGAQNTSGPL